ncbi:uncharacterized protein CLUP02_13318 [Colletotrichum lupini]|uniref:Uncharacterized protein n=1 Tax=Colletotrichum lupini TaxID=145971 RepID=A0A9Q8T2N7_9PEZI|nr:uncharacterized protein CLUP02_13318 [Colletotrichum lupini]UQC87798.1 hypothetical protein CLUP02_13318 [Colletotrichum lupini]
MLVQITLVIRASGCICDAAAERDLPAVTLPEGLKKSVPVKLGSRLGHFEVAIGRKLAQKLSGCLRQEAIALSWQQERQETEQERAGKRADLPPVSPPRWLFPSNIMSCCTYLDVPYVTQATRQARTLNMKSQLLSLALQARTEGRALPYVSVPEMTWKECGASSDNHRHILVAAFTCTPMPLDQAESNRDDLRSLPLHPCYDVYVHGYRVFSAHQPTESYF